MNTIIPRNTTEWFDLPFEMAEQVIEEMDKDTKFNFFTSAPHYLKVIPRNYVKQVEFRMNQLKVQSFDGSEFMIDFAQFCGYAEVTCLKNGKQMWRRLEVFSMRLAIAIYFQRIVRNSFNLEKLVIISWDFPFDKTNIQELKRIKHLIIHQENPVDLYDKKFMTPKQFPANAAFDPTHIETSKKLKENEIEILDIDFFDAAIARLERSNSVICLD